MRGSLRRRRGGALGLVAATLAASATLLAVPPAGAGTAHHPTLRRVNVHGYGAVLSDSRGFALYVLSAERGGKIVCKGACLKAWPPLLVSSKVKTVSLGSGIKGKIGFVKRSATTKQVTDNGYPLYTFVADSKPGQANGEGINHFGGTWYLVRPQATSVKATPITGRTAKTTAARSSSGGW